MYVKQKTIVQTPNKQMYKNKATTKYQLNELKKRIAFNDSEIQVLKSRFDEYAEDGILNKLTFREMVGIIGCDEAPFLSDRIFYVMDENQTEMVNFENYVSYLNKMINGTDKEKAELSFKFLDIGKKQYLEPWDIEKMIQEVSALWKHLSESKVVPQKYYVDKVINLIDQKKIGKVAYVDYLVAYQKTIDTFDWYEYFNSDEIVFEDISASQQMLLAEQEKKNHIQSIKNTIVSIEEEIQLLMIQIKESESQKSDSNISQFIRSPNKSISPTKKQIHKFANSQENSQNTLVYNFSNLSPVTKLQQQNSNQNQQNPNNISQFMSYNEDHQLNNFLQLQQFENLTLLSDQKRGVDDEIQNGINNSQSQQLNDPSIKQTGPLFVNSQADPNTGDQELKGNEDGILIADSDEEDEDFQHTKQKFEKYELENDINQKTNRSQLNMEDISMLNNQNNPQNNQQLTVSQIQQNSMQISFKNQNELNDSNYSGINMQFFDQKLYFLDQLEERLQLLQKKTEELETLINTPLNVHASKQDSLKKPSLSSSNSYRISFKQDDINHLFNRDSICPVKGSDNEDDDDNSSLKQRIQRKQTIKNIPSRVQKSKKEVKHNLYIYLGHENWNIILNLTIGIRYSVKHLFVNIDKDPEKSEFSRKIHKELISKTTNKEEDNIAKAFTFTDYSPSVFEHIRLNFQIERERFLRSIGPEKLLGNLIMGRMNSLSELCRCVPNKKGQETDNFIYFTEDGQYLSVTISKKEEKVFMRILRDYYNYLKQNPNTYLCRYYGVHKLKIQNNRKIRKIRFLTGGNIFSQSEIDHRYEIKGSTRNRTAKVKGETINAQIPLKDLDLIEDKRKMKISESDKQKLRTQLKKDIDFLIYNKLFNYRVLIGFHKVKQEDDQLQYLQFLKNQNLSQSQNQNQNQNQNQEFKKKQNDFKTSAKSFKSIDGQHEYFLGITHYFQEYETSNSIASSFKSTAFGSTMSTVPPQQYGDRLLDFIDKHLLS